MLVVSALGQSCTVEEEKQRIMALWDFDSWKDVYHQVPPISSVYRMGDYFMCVPWDYEEGG